MNSSFRAGKTGADRVLYVVPVYTCTQLTVVVVTRILANAHTPEFLKLWSSQTESLRLKYGNTIQQHPDAEVVRERVRKVVTAIDCVSRRKSEMASNRPKHGGDQEESPPVTKTKAAA
jgi:hypothetical protein